MDHLADADVEGWAVGGVIDVAVGRILGWFVATAAVDGGIAAQTDVATVGQIADCCGVADDEGCTVGDVVTVAIG